MSDDIVERAYTAGTFRPRVITGKPTGDGARPNTEYKPKIVPITWFCDVQPNIETTDLVESLLGTKGMCVIYGESGCGKTFFASDLGLHIALGWDWNNKRVEKMGVIYCAMEGTIGVQNRLAAFKQQHDLYETDVPFGFVSVPLDLSSSDSDAAAVILAINSEAARLGVKVGLVIMDTLARGMAGGNENSPDDMGALVQNGDKIRDEVGAALAWVHHSGKDTAKGARGHSSLRAATDTEIEITVCESGDHIARVTKQREYECDGTFTFRLRVVELGRNKWNRPVTSCVVEYQTDPAVPAGRTKPRPLIGHAKRALDILVDLGLSVGVQGMLGIPAGVLAVPEKAWRDTFYDRAMPAAEYEAKRKAFARASSDLVAARIVGMAEKHVWVVGKQSTDGT